MKFILKLSKSEAFSQISSDYSFLFWNGEI